MEWAADGFRTKHITGDIGNPGSYNGQSMKTTEIAQSPANKIMQGDWIWHPNRGWDNRKSLWHNYKGKSQANILFGDMHVEAYRFPTIKDTDAFWAQQIRKVVGIPPVCSRAPIFSGRRYRGGLASCG
jgi:hypothetical protein